jgi:hypothetical protein
VFDGSIEMDWYYRGSTSAGTGTEGGITVGIENISKFLKEMEFKDLVDFFLELRRVAL